jgi:protoporphyrinogen oxidase
LRAADDVDVAVLGGGPAGIAAALRLARDGRRVVVLERAPDVGGLARSFDVAGVRVDHGSHRLHPSTPAPVMALLRELLGDDLQRRRRHGRIALSGALVAFPPQPTDLVRHLPPRLSARLGRDVVVAAARRSSPEPRTFADAVARRFGPTMLREFYGPYATKLFGAPPDALDAELARRRIGARSGTDVLRRARRRGPDTGVFFYARRGFGQIVDALAAAATDAGGCIRTGADVRAIAASPEHVDIELGDGSRVRARNAWSTLPLPVLAHLARAPAAVATAARGLEYRSMVLAYLVVERPRWTEFDAHYFPAADVAMSRVSEPKNYRDNADDPTDRTVLCVELPCAHGDALWEASGDELAERIEDGLARSGLPVASPVAVEVRRVERAYPVYGLDYAPRFDAVDAWAGALPNVLTFGRQGLFAHDNTHHAFAMAWAAVDALRDDGTVDASAWSGARDRFRAHVVED